MNRFLILFPITILACVAFAQTPVLNTYQPTQVKCNNLGSISLSPIYPGYTYDYGQLTALYSGHIATNGLSGTLSFEYGETLTYGHQIVIGTISNDTTVSANVTTTFQNSYPMQYYCRLKFVTASGIYYGNEIAYVPAPSQFTHCEMKRYGRSSPMQGPEMVLQNFNDYPLTMNVIWNTNYGTFTLGCVRYEREHVFSNNDAYPEMAEFQIIDNGYLREHVYLQPNSYWDDSYPAVFDLWFYPMGMVFNSVNGVLSQGFMFGVHSLSDTPVTFTGINILAEEFTFTVPAYSSPIVICPMPDPNHAMEVQLELRNNDQSQWYYNAKPLPWEGTSTLNSIPISLTADSATFDLVNSTDSTQTAVVRSFDGTTVNRYPIDAYATQRITVANQHWYLGIVVNNLMGPWAASGTDFVLIKEMIPGRQINLTVATDSLFISSNPIHADTIRLTSRIAWNASCSANWVTLGRTTGDGGIPLPVTASPNTTTANRHAMVYIATASGDIDSVAVKQYPVEDNALAFDGVDDNVVISTGVDLGSTNGYTIETWLKWTPNSTSDVQFICAKANEQMEIHTGPNLIRFIPRLGVYIDAAYSIPVGVWTHIACEFDASQSLGKIFVNGFEQPVSVTGSLSSAFYSSTANFQLGRRNDGSRALKGCLDGFRVWNGIRTQTQLWETLQRQISVADYPTLICDYNFNEGSSGQNNARIGILPDRTGHGFDGVLLNFALTDTTSNWVASEVVDTHLNTPYQPMMPTQLTVTTSGINADLAWNQVTHDIYGGPVAVTNYIIYYRSNLTNTWQYLNYTTGVDATTYTHTGVVRFSPAMYYRVTAITGGASSSDCLRTIPVGTSEMEVQRILGVSLQNR